MNNVRAIKIIRKCLKAGRYLVLAHFVQRMDQRGLFWPDVQAVIDFPTTIRENGCDEFGRSRWLIAGRASDALVLEVLCVLDDKQRDGVTVFITLYWKD